MRSIKSVGELIRGCGFDESTSLVRLLPIPAYGEVHKAVHEITHLPNSFSEEMDKDQTKSRMEHDSKTCNVS